jgi:hypothetical protein
MSPPIVVEASTALFALTHRARHTQRDKAPPSEASTRTEPPKIAEFCLGLFLSNAKSAGMIGDLSEQFAQDCQQIGERRARRVYWARTMRSLWPLFRRMAARTVRWGVVIETVRRFL